MLILSQVGVCFPLRMPLKQKKRPCRLLGRPGLRISFPCRLWQEVGAHDDARASCCRTLSTASSYMDCCCWDVFLNSLKCLLDFWFCKCSQTAFREDGKTKSWHVERLSFLLQMVAPTSAFSRAVKLVAAVARSGLSGFASGMGAHCW